ncbi:MAG: hypothetical protein ABUL41_00920, partial [Chitinophagaceae bacterium]
IQAIKISKVSADTGHAAHNTIPLAIAIKRLMKRFKLIVYVKIGVVCGDANYACFHKIKFLWNKDLLTSNS